MASYKRGPLAGIEYSSERQKRNAREYYLSTGIAIDPENVRTRARGLYGEAQRGRDVERSIRVREELGMSRAEYDYNHAYFRARWEQQNVGRIVKRSTAEFERIWKAAERKSFQPSKQFHDLLLGAGMRTGYKDGVLNWPRREHYMEYVSMKWDDLESLGYQNVSAEIALEALEFERERLQDIIDEHNRGDWD